MNKDPKKRINCQQALKHSFFKSINNNNENNKNNNKNKTDTNWDYNDKIDESEEDDDENIPHFLRKPTPIQLIKQNSISTPSHSTTTTPRMPATPRLPSASP